jgi:streptogrisin C
VCKSGDSGSPVFFGDTAYGILKGGSYRPDGSCAFYFYMSTDYLPSGWRLLTADPAGHETIPAPSLSGLVGRAG